jgi:hypothetical protein
VEIYGDNRDGETAAYTLTDGVERSDLEADLILDIYILDGADALPDRSDLARYDAAGNTLEGSEGTL